MKTIVAIVIVLGLGLAGLGLKLHYNRSGSLNIDNGGDNLSGGEAVFCTMDAKLCPDGSYVGRTGPKCEFDPCPIVNNAR